MHSIDFFISTNYLVNFPWKHEDSEMVALKTPKLPTLFRNWQFLLVTIIVPCYTFDAKSFFPTSESPVSACTKCYLRKKYCIGQGGKECWNQLQCALVCKIMLTICYRSAYLAAFLKPNLQNSLQLSLEHFTLGKSVSFAFLSTLAGVSKFPYFSLALLSRLAWGK